MALCRADSSTTDTEKSATVGGVDTPQSDVSPQVLIDQELVAKDERANPPPVYYDPAEPHDLAKRTCITEPDDTAPVDSIAPASPGVKESSAEARGPEIAKETAPVPVVPPGSIVPELPHHPGFVGQFINTPKPRGLATSVALYYCGWFSTATVAVLAVRDEEWTLFIVNVCALFLPGIVHSVNMFFVLAIVKKDMDKNEKRKEALLTVLNLNKIMEVRRFFNGTPPIWSLLFKSRLVQLTSNTLPAMTINIMSLVSGSLEPGFTRNFLFFNTMFGLCLASLSAKLVHTCNGPPGNMQKYRYWDVETRPYFHVFIMLVIDFCQIYYRLVGLALVAVFAGVWHEVLLIILMSFVTGAFAKVGLQVVPAYVGVENLMSAITGFENVIYDYPWLEPVPVYSFYIEVSYLFRLLQVIVGSVIISAHWEERHYFDETMFYVFFGSCASCTALYLLVYPFYVFYLMKDRVAASYEKRDEFISTMLKKKFDRDSGNRLQRGKSFSDRTFA